MEVVFGVILIVNVGLGGSTWVRGGGGGIERCCGVTEAGATGETETSEGLPETSKGYSTPGCGCLGIFKCSSKFHCPEPGAKAVMDGAEGTTENGGCGGITMVEPTFGNGPPMETGATFGAGVNGAKVTVGTVALVICVVTV